MDDTDLARAGQLGAGVVELRSRWVLAWRRDCGGLCQLVP